MRKRRINSKKPMFKKRRTPAKTALNVILVIVLLAALAFLGYSVGKPIMEFLDAKKEPQPVIENNLPEEEPSKNAETKPIETEPPVSVVTEDQQIEEPPVETGKRILFVSPPNGAGYDGYLDERIEFAKNNGYYGIALELMANGGTIYFNTASELAAGSELTASAISPLGLKDLSATAAKISEAGLLPYARISALTDHIVSWNKSVCYLFENSTSTWLDNSVSEGGKPWISAFSDTARSYISGVVGEISSAGFYGIIAGELEFPPFRNSDLNYVGASVKSSTRYTALTDFSNALEAAVGEAKSYGVEVDAQDLIAGRAEVLNDLGALNAGTVYVKYDSAAIGLRIVKTDETEISYSGLSETDKVTVVFKNIAEIIGDKKTVIPAVTDEALVPTLVGMGYDEKTIVIY